MVQMMSLQSSLVVLAGLAVVASAEVFFEENFDTFDTTKWVSTSIFSSKENENKKSEMGAFTHTAGEWHVDAEVNKGIQTSADMMHYAIRYPVVATYKRNVA